MGRVCVISAMASKLKVLASPSYFMGISFFLFHELPYFSKSEGEEVDYYELIENRWCHILLIDF